MWGNGYLGPYAFFRLPQGKAISTPLDDVLPCLDMFTYHYIANSELSPDREDELYVMPASRDAISTGRNPSFSGEPLFYTQRDDIAMDDVPKELASFNEQYSEILNEIQAVVAVQYSIRWGLLLWYT